MVHLDDDDDDDNSEDGDGNADGDDNDFFGGLHWFTWSLIDCSSHVRDSSIFELCKSLYLS